MIFDNIEFHNVAEMRVIPGRGGLLLQRVPEYIRSELRPGTQIQYMRAAGVEIRFVSNTYPVTVKLINYGEPEKAVICFGDYQHQVISIKKGLNELVIDMPERFSRALPFLKDYLFAPNVLRIIFYGMDSEIHYLRVDGGPVRPPERNEIPSRRYLAYGTSITQGAVSATPLLTFASLTARRLKADLINLGASGNCFCEEALADYIAERDDWDFATLCLSVNMLNQGITTEEFYKKARYFISTIARENPEKAVFCISILPYFLDLGISNPGQEVKSTPEEFREAIKTIVEELKLSNVFYIDGRDVLDDFGGLTADLIHPGDLGMIRISENLSNIISRTINI